MKRLIIGYCFYFKLIIREKKTISWNNFKKSCHQGAKSRKASGEICHGYFLQNVNFMEAILEGQWAVLMVCVISLMN